MAPLNATADAPAAVDGIIDSRPDCHDKRLRAWLAARKVRQAGQRDPYADMDALRAREAAAFDHLMELCPETT